MKDFKLCDTVDIINFGTNKTEERSLKTFLCGCDKYKSINSKGTVHENYYFYAFDNQNVLREYYAGDSYPYMRIYTCRMVLFEKQNKYLIL